ncbi:hypothetical protein Dimus_007450 [Dionaea muscipula]
MDELTKLCGVDGCLVVYNPEDKDLFAWPNAEEAENLLAVYTSMPKMERAKKALNHEQYIEARDKKLRSQIAKHEKRNKEMKASLLMNQITHGEREIDELTQPELEVLSWFSGHKLEYIARRTQLLPK